MTVHDLLELGRGTLDLDIDTLVSLRWNAQDRTMIDRVKACETLGKGVLRRGDITCADMR